MTPTIAVLNERLLSVPSRLHTPRLPYHARTRFVSCARAAPPHSVARRLSHSFGATRAAAEDQAAAKQPWSVRQAAASRTRITLVRPLRGAAANTWRTLHERALRGKLRPNPSLKRTLRSMGPLSSNVRLHDPAMPHIRDARLEDVPALCAAERAVVQQFDGMLVSEPDEITESHFIDGLTAISGGKGKYLVVEDGGVLMAHASLWPMGLKKVSHVLSEPPRDSRRPVGLSQTGAIWLSWLFVSSSIQPPQGPPEASGLGHVLMVQPSCSAADRAGLVVVEAWACWRQ